MKNNAKWDILEVVLMAYDKEKEHEDWLNSLSDEAFEKHLKKLHMEKLQRKVG